MVVRSAPYGGIMHEVVEHAGVLYLAGLVAEDLKPDIASQAEDIFRQLETLLKAHGSSLSNLLQATIYLVDVKHRDGFNAVWQRRIPAAAMPARASIGVVDLGLGVLVELVVTAAKSP
jgi:enamine deaminase RidA (YjgF/YER057c/UK114 family)